MEGNIKKKVIKCRLMCSGEESRGRAHSNKRKRKRGTGGCSVVQTERGVQGVKEVDGAAGIEAAAVPYDGGGGVRDSSAIYKTFKLKIIILFIYTGRTQRSSDVTKMTYIIN